MTYNFFLVRSSFIRYYAHAKTEILKKVDRSHFWKGYFRTCQRDYYHIGGFERENSDKVVAFPIGSF